MAHSERLAANRVRKPWSRSAPRATLFTPRASSRRAAGPLARCADSEEKSSRSGSRYSPTRSTSSLPFAVHRLRKPHGDVVGGGPDLRAASTLGIYRRIDPKGLLGVLPANLPRELLEEAATSGIEERAVGLGEFVGNRDVDVAAHRALTIQKLSAVLSVLHLRDRGE